MDLGEKDNRNGSPHIFVNLTTGIYAGKIISSDWWKRGQAILKSITQPNKAVLKVDFYR